MGIPGNSGLNCGVTELLSDFVTFASRYVYDPAMRRRPTCASADSSIPCALNDCELTYAPEPTAAATSGAIPNCGSRLLLTNSTRSKNSLLKYETRARARP